MQYKKLLSIALLAGLALLYGCSQSKQPTAMDATPTSPPNIVVTPDDSSHKEQSTDPSLSNPSSTMSPTSTSDPTATSAPTSSPIPTATPTPSPSPTPIPTVPAAPVSVNTDLDTYTFLVNREYPLSESYVPKDLTTPNIPFSFSDKSLDKRKLRTVAADALEELYQAALSEEGLKIYGVSGYRSYDRQYDIYGTNLINKGLIHTNSYSAAPGTSEHQSGLAIDVSCSSIGYALINSFATTAEGKWLKENCWRFGFILRYPKDKEDITGYAYEPWHIRYVGVPLAYYLYTNNLTLDEYYGAHSTYSLNELAKLPLIDTTTNRFYRLYAYVMNSQLITLADGSIPVSTSTGYPYVCEPITNAAGEVLTSGTTTYYNSPILDAKGKLILSADDKVCYKKPYFDASGNLWIDYNGVPAYLDPLWNADGTIAKDASGNILYAEPVVDGNGTEYITSTGGIMQKLPIRVNNELTYTETGSVAFYEPITIPGLGYFFYNADGKPLFSQDYYAAIEASTGVGSEESGSTNSGSSESNTPSDTTTSTDTTTPSDTNDASESDHMDETTSDVNTDYNPSENPDSSETTDPTVTPGAGDEYGIEGYPVG